MEAAATMQAKVDPLRTLPLSELVRRTELPRRTIEKWLAQDEADGTPNRRFPRPSINGANARTKRWREASVVKWLEQREQEIE